MFEGKRVLAVVPARSGSKGIPGKNMAEGGGLTLIGRAGRCLRALSWLDRAVISTDDAGYAEEGARNGLAAPFLRPAELASDTAGAVDTLLHALCASEEHFGESYDIVLVIEPTSPLRLPEDIERSVAMLVESGADSVVTVSPLPHKYHPRKVFTLDGGHIGFYERAGASVVNRQELDDLYWRNGVCYALTRECLVDRRAVITDRSEALVIERDVANIDEPAELEWARYLIEREDAALKEEG